MKLFAFSALIVLLLSATSSGQERFEISKQKVISHTQVVRDVISLQQQCLDILRGSNPDLSICKTAEDYFIAEITLSDMSLYLDAVAEKAMRDRNIPLLDLSSDYMFFVQSARDLSLQIYRTMTEEQHQVVGGYTPKVIN